MGLIVDTSVLIDAERRSHQLADLELGHYLQRTGHTDFGISVITLSEIVYGHAYSQRAPNQDKERVLTRLRAVLPIFPMTESIAVRAGHLNAELRHRGKPVGFADVLIAATALELRFGVLTHNVRHLSYVPGLQVVDAGAV